MHIIFNFGYLDPGTGSMFIQSIIGIAAGISIFGRKAIGGFVSKIKSGTSKSTSKK